MDEAKKKVLLESSHPPLLYNDNHVLNALRLLDSEEPDGSPFGNSWLFDDIPEDVLHGLILQEKRSSLAGDSHSPSELGEEPSSTFAEHRFVSGQQSYPTENGYGEVMLRDAFINEEEGVVVTAEERTELSCHMQSNYYQEDASAY